MKFDLTTKVLRFYVPLIIQEIMKFIKRASMFCSFHETFNVSTIMTKIIIYTISRSLQKKEVRSKFDSSFVDLYHHLDINFFLINFMLSWASLSHNQKRNFAQRKMTQTYLEIIRAWRQEDVKKNSNDMIWNLMSCAYKNDDVISNFEIAHMMIVLLMIEQHSFSSTIAWIILRLISRSDILEELYVKQCVVLELDFSFLTYDFLQRLSLNAQVIKKTLRLHASIHFIMRKIKSSIQAFDSLYTISTSHVLLVASNVISKLFSHFLEFILWKSHRWNVDSSLNVIHLVVDDAAAEEEEEKVNYNYDLVSKDAKSSYLFFDVDRHRCIDEAFAYVQLSIIVVIMMRAFHFRNLNDVKDVDGTDYSSLFSRFLNSTFVHWKRRNAKKKNENGMDDGEKEKEKEELELEKRWMIF